MARGSSATSQRSVQNAKRDLQKLLRRIDTVPTKVLEEEAQKLYGEILAEVPYDTGKLSQSVKVSVAKDKKRPGLNASASVRSKRGYNYAGIQHENEDFKHTKGKAYYIRDPFRRATKRIARKLRKELKP